MYKVRKFGVYWAFIEISIQESAKMFLGKQMPGVQIILNGLTLGYRIFNVLICEIFIKIAKIY